MRGDDAVLDSRESPDGVCEHRKGAVVVWVDLAVRYVRLLIGIGEELTWRCCDGRRCRLEVRR